VLRLLVAHVVVVPHVAVRVLGAAGFRAVGALRLLLVAAFARGAAGDAPPVLDEEGQGALGDAAREEGGRVGRDGGLGAASSVAAAVAEEVL
jgi:hypothetical protein